MSAAAGHEADGDADFRSDVETENPVGVVVRFDDGASCQPGGYRLRRVEGDLVDAGLAIGEKVYVPAGGSASYVLSGGNTQNGATSLAGNIEAQAVEPPAGTCASELVRVKYSHDDPLLDRRV